jgi:hypothetical protein
LQYHRFAPTVAVLVGDSQYPLYRFRADRSAAILVHGGKGKGENDKRRCFVLLPRRLAFHRCTATAPIYLPILHTCDPQIACGQIATVHSFQKLHATQKNQLHFDYIEITLRVLAPVPVTMVLF